MKLGVWLRARSIAPAVVAHELDVAGETMRRYLNGTRIPTHDLMRRLVEFTGGDVTPNDWFDLHLLVPGRFPVPADDSPAGAGGGGGAPVHQAAAPGRRR